MGRYTRLVVLLVVGVAFALVISSTAAAARFVVVFKNGHSGAGFAAVHKAGGRILDQTRIGVATVASTNPFFELDLRASGTVAGVAHDAFFHAAGTGPPHEPGAATGRAAVSVPPVDTEKATCATLYSVPSSNRPDPLSSCQWDMRAIKATPSGSYAATTGAGVTVGVMDTGVDLKHPDIAPRLNVAKSCSFIYATTPTSLPAEQVKPGDCSNKSAIQDYAGHGTHTAGTIAAPINGIGTSGVAPGATIVALKAGTAEGYFFTDSVVNALTYAGDKRIDVVNMSFFADPWLFNCAGDPEQNAIIQAIGRAAAYAQRRGVVLVAAAGNEGNDLDNPTVDDISPDYPPGSNVTRKVDNTCLVLPQELPGVVDVSATGAQNLLAWYSNYGLRTIAVTAPGGSRFQTPSPDTARGRVLAPYSSTAADLADEEALGRLVVDPKTGAYYAWLNGTSMAAPHVAGIAALIRARQQGQEPREVAATLRATATPMPCPSALDPGVVFFGAPVQVCTGTAKRNSFYGSGLANALAAATDNGQH